MVVYLATLNHWVSFNSLPEVAKVCGWTWQPELTGPLYWALTLPLRLLPGGLIPVALNLFSTVCAVLTLALLARSVALLPQNRTQEQRERQESEFSLLSIRGAWLPPLLAAAVLGLQLTFWEDATSASGQMTDLSATPYANHATAHPMQDWSCHICYQHRAPHPLLADLVSNPTPPGQIARVRETSVSVYSRKFPGRLILLRGWIAFCFLHTAIRNISCMSLLYVILKFRSKLKAHHSAHQTDVCEEDAFLQTLFDSNRLR